MLKFAIPAVRVLNPLFPIPMRGNEFECLEADVDATHTVNFPVSDPHEG